MTPYEDILRLPNNLLDKIDFNGNRGCWTWLASLTNQGYGQHKVVFEIIKGKRVPEGKHLDHTCCSPEWCSGGKSCVHRSCVNPDHMTIRTAKDNVLRSNSVTAKNAVKTHCLRGHEFNKANTYRTKNNKRQCRACNALRSAS